MTSIHDYTGGDYLKAADLNNQEKTLQLAGFKLEQVAGDDGKETKCVAEFVGQTKKMIVSAKANVKVLLELFATDQIEVWDERVKSSPISVTLFTEATNFGPGLRLKPAQQANVEAQQSPQVPPDMMDMFQKFLQTQRGQS